MSAIRGSKAEVTRQNNLIRERVKGRMAALHLTMPVLARRMGISERTLQRMLADPGRMSLTECRLLAAEMDWKHDTAGEVLFG